MDILIQNNGSSPLYIQVRGEDSSISRTIFFNDHEVTKISQEVYEKFVITSPFFKSRLEDGTIRVLNADMLGESAVKQNEQLQEVAYQKYVDMMKKIRSAGGLANKQFAPYLNADGTPKLELLNANFGRNIDPEVAEQFRTRYLAEAGEGMHEDTLVLPGGARVDTGHRDVDVQIQAQTDENEEQEEEDTNTLIDKQIASVKTMKLADLKQMADAMEIEYDPTVTERQLRSKITSKLREQKEEE